MDTINECTESSYFCLFQCHLKDKLLFPVVASDTIELDVTEYLVNIKYYYSEMNTCDEIFCYFLTEAHHVFCHMNRCGMWMRVYVCDGSWMISICMI